MTDTHSYSESGSSGLSALKWSAIGLAGRQGLVALSYVIIARFLGPEPYAVVALAISYVALSLLLLDQGISASLISRGSISRAVVGAAMSLNMLLAIAVGLVTFVAAPAIAGFFSQPDLEGVLRALAAGLIVKGATVIPRAVLSRRGAFGALAKADVTGAVLGVTAGVAVAASGGGVWAIVAQTVLMDCVTLLFLLLAARPPRLNLKLGHLRGHWGFSLNVFGSSSLGYLASNSDNLLIARFLGPQSLGLYSLPYTISQFPVALTGQVVSRVLFPIVARRRFQKLEVHSLVERAIRGIALVTFPLMALLAAAAADLTSLFLGAEWLSAAPVLAILCISGARQSITTLSGPVLLGLGRADIQFKFSLAAAIVQVAGIVIGLNWGIVGVAIGYTTAGFLVTPAIAFLQRKFAGISILRQVRALVPSAHAALWLAAVYFFLRLVIDLPLPVTFVLCSIAALLTYLLVLFVAHREVWSSLWRDFLSVYPSRKPRHDDR